MLQLDLEKTRRFLNRLVRVKVPDTPELRRVYGLPRRQWQTEVVDDLGTSGQMCDVLSHYFRTSGGLQVLRPVQAKALQELHDFGGLFGPIPVGEGKTLITWLAPVVLEAQRTLLVVPAKLREKTLRDFKALSWHWKSVPIAVESYERLSREGGTALLQRLQPDLLLFDEAHRLANREAAVTRRISAWMKAHPETRVVALSGTITRRSLRNFGHLSEWCSRELTPLPRVPRELEAWSAAVDEIKPTENRIPCAPGALQAFCNEDEAKQGRNGVRSAIRRRIQDTPTVVSLEPTDVGASLNIFLTLITGYSPQTEVLAQDLRQGKKPNGEPVTDTDLSAKWRIFRTLTSGFWYRWDPEPPAEWRSARFVWKQVARDVLQQHLPGFESEALVAKAAASGRLGAEAQEAHRAWKAVSGAYTPDVVPVWVDDRMVNAIVEWSKTHVGIIWVSEIALGRRLEELGFSYYHELGRNAQGDPIEAADPSRCVVASVLSNSEGRNLQAWNDNLVVTPMPDGQTWEQLLGRTHRIGQEADEVNVEVFFGCRVEWECWVQAQKDARYASAIEFPKKLTYATITGFQRPDQGALWL